MVVGIAQDPSTHGAFVHSVAVTVTENEKLSITVQPHGTSLNLGTHEKPVQSVSIMVTAVLETTWSTRSTQTLVSISGMGPSRYYSFMRAL